MFSIPEKPSTPEEVKKESNFARSITVLSLACTVIALLLLGVMALKIYEPWGLLVKPSSVDTTPQKLCQLEALQKIQEIRLALLTAKIAYLESKDTAKVTRQLNTAIAGLDNLGKISSSNQKMQADKVRTDFKAVVRDIEKDPKNMPASLEQLLQGVDDLQEYYLVVVLPEK